MNIIGFIPLSALQIIQGIWWIIAELVIEKRSTFAVVLLSSVCIALRFINVFLHLKLNKFLISQNTLQIANNIFYIEASLQNNQSSSLLIYINSLIILLNYLHQKEHQQIINGPYLLNHVLPFYMLVRVIAETFIQFNLLILEGVVVLFSLLLMLYHKTSIKQITQTNKSPIKITEPISPLKNRTTILRDAKQITHNRNKHVSIQEKAQQFDRFGTQVLINIKNDEDKDDETNPPSKFHSQIRQISRSVQFIHDRTDQLLTNFYKNLVNILPEGVVILNKSQQIYFMSQKCEKLLECENQDKNKIVECIKQYVSNCVILTNETETTNTSKKTKNSQKSLIEIIRIYRQLQQPIDVLDILLNPNSHIQILKQRFTQTPLDLNQEIDSNSVEQENFYCFDCKLKKENGELLKRLKITLIQTQMTLAQQEHFSQQNMSNYRKSTENDQSINSLEPILLILIKNITHKHNFLSLKDEQMVNNSLLRSFSHELRTPLNSCQQMLNIIKDINKSDQQALFYIDIASSSIKLLTHQLNDILDFSAFQSSTFQYHFTTFSIPEIIDEISNLYLEQIKYKQLQLNIFCEKELQDIKITNDKQRIIQVIVNLLNNACKYTRVNGNISLTFKFKEQQITTVSVRDNGIGIKEQNLSLIKKFLTKSSSILAQDFSCKMKCLGLGLNVSSKIVSGLKYGIENTLKIKSIHQQGTKVKFSFLNLNIKQDKSQLDIQNNTLPEKQPKREPLLNESILMKEIESPRFDDEVTKGLIIPSSQYNFKSNLCQSMISFQQPYQQDCMECSQILIVDDIPFNCIAFSSTLSHFSIKFDLAYDGYQAIEMVKNKLNSHCQYYKLIFMDIEMPGINGFQTSQIINQILNKKATIIICSAYDTQDNYNEAEQVGVHEFLSKPVDQKELKKLLQKHQFRL